MPLFGSDEVHFKGQDYHKLKKDLQTKKALFYDPEFPPEGKSLFYSSGKLTGVVWKRPKDICDNPKLFVAGASAGDVTQGRLGNCWFVAASSCLALYNQLLTRVVPHGQEWDENKPDDYTGIFHFQFWRYGKWVDVVIDDQLPTINDELVFIHSQEKNEFWSALLEKAYAKLFGCYECLDGGDLGEALEDFTGGVSEQISIPDQGVVDDPDKRAEFFARLTKEKDRKSLLAASIPAASSEEMEASTDMGLVKGHAYGVTAVKNISLESSSGLFSFFNKNKLPMVRLRNPWGQGEWKGRFSDNDPEWNKISKGEREKMGIVFEEDGEFWMSFEDFCTHFENVSYCRVVNTSVFSISKTWHEGIGHSAWVSPGRAGGCLNNKDTFLQNPQFLFDIKEDKEDTMMQLMQKSTRGASGSENTTIGFTLLKVEENRCYRMHDYKTQEMIQNTVFKDSRSIFHKMKLQKGRYAVVTCTFDPNVEREFLFRIYTGSGNDFKELVHDKPQKGFWSCCGRQPQMLTRIKVLKAEGLERQETGGADPYCIISCEGEKVRTRTCNDTLNPEWGVSAIFYRKNPVSKSLKIQIWNSNVIKDTYMGKHIFISTDDCTSSVQAVDLISRGKETAAKPGKLYVEITQTRNLVLL